MSIIPILEGQRETSEHDTNENHEEHTADIVNADAVSLVVVRVALLLRGIFLPPFVL
jgi:hypothetical protein